MVVVRGSGLQMICPSVVGADWTEQVPKSHCLFSKYDFQCQWPRYFYLALYKSYWDADIVDGEVHLFANVGRSIVIISWTES